MRTKKTMTDVNVVILTYVKDNLLFDYEEQSRELIESPHERGSRIIAYFKVGNKTYELKITRLSHRTRIAVRNKGNKKIVHGKESLELYRQVKEIIELEIKRQTNVKDIRDRK